MQESTYRVKLKIDWRSLFWDLVRSIPVVFLLSLLIAMGAYIYSKQTYAPTYTTTATFVVTVKGSVSTSSANMSKATQLSGVFSEVMDSTALKNLVMEDLSLSSLPVTVTTGAIENTNLMTLSVQAPTPQLSFKVMQSMIRNYPEISNYIVKNAVMEILEPPSIPVSPDTSGSARQLVYQVFGFSVVLLFCAVGLFSFLRDTVKKEDELEEKLDASLAGTVYREKRSLQLFGRKQKKSFLITNLSTSFSFVESFKKLRNLLEHEHRKHGAKMFLITSVLENEGKSTVAANLALSLAKDSKKVLLVDADLRKPAQYKILERRGLKTVEFSDVLAGTAPLSDAVRFDKEYGIYTIFNQSTERDSTELLRRKQIARILQALREEMDYIILDSAPVSMVADAELLAGYADAVLLVVRQDYARTADINDAIDRLSTDHARMIGCVYNMAAGSPVLLQRIGGKYAEYYHGGYYGYDRYAKRADRSTRES